MLNGSRSSEGEVVLDHFLIDLGIVCLECCFKKCFSLKVGIYLFLKAHQLCILLVE